MFFNTHCHVFNFATLGTKTAHRVLAQRMAQILSPLAPGYATPFFRGLLSELQIGVDLVAALQKKLPLAPENVRFALQPLAAAPGQAVPGLMGDKYHPSVITLAHFLWIESHSTVAKVATHLLEETDKGLRECRIEGQSAIVPLMLDIASSGTEDPKRWKDQVSQTLDLVDQEPTKGRVFPFYALNPARPNAIQTLETLLSESGGHRIKGIKLYPALAPSLSKEWLLEVARLAVKNNLPITTHCMMDGFTPDLDSGRHGFPGLWRSVLGDPSLSNLRVCFAHFGGDDEWAIESFRSEVEGCRGCWPRQIIELMRQFPNNVFADLAFHVNVLDWQKRQDSKDHEEAADAKRRLDTYKANLDYILGDAELRRQLLWGTDYPINQLMVTEVAYYRSFHALIGDHFRAIAEENPIRFLGTRSL